MPVKVVQSQIVPPPPLHSKQVSHCQIRGGGGVMNGQTYHNKRPTSRLTLTVPKPVGFGVNGHHGQSISFSGKMDISFIVVIQSLPKKCRFSNFSQTLPHHYKRKTYLTQNFNEYPNDSKF